MAVYTAIDNPELYFQTKLYTGDGNSTQAITLDGSEDMQPDLNWIKNRGAANSHVIHDVLRGVGDELSSDSDAAEGTADPLASFDSDGFTLGGSGGGINGNTETYVSWNWKMGTTTGIAGSPSITPASYSFNATAGQSIIKYVGNGTADATIPHGLSTAPKMVIIKNLTTQEGWVVGHEGIRGSGLGWTKIMKLNTTAAEVTSSAYFGDVAPSATLVTLGDDGGVNTNTDNYIAYCFSEISGYSKFSSYTGNGSADGPFIYTGFRPAFLIYKPVDQVDNWEMHNSATDTFNPMDTVLYPNLNNAESDPASTTDRLDFLSNGFKMRTASSDYNGSGNDYIYIAFAEAPFVNSNGVPCNAN